jgi:hypothetical protein
VAGALVSLAAVLPFVGLEAGRDVALGLLGPLVAVTGSWVLIERAHRKGAGHVMPVILRTFVWKVVFFGAYVVAMITRVHVDPIPFVISFTVYFVTLYFVQAVLLQRLVARGAPPAPPPSVTTR